MLKRRSQPFEAGRRSVQRLEPRGRPFGLLFGAMPPEFALANERTDYLEKKMTASLKSNEAICIINEIRVPITK